MCYELYFKSQKPAQNQHAEKAAPVIARVPAAKPVVQRQPDIGAKEKQELESELETSATA